MARFFDQSKIDEFKECFYFNARKGYVQNDTDLLLIMRSLDRSPTKQEVHRYYQKYASSDPSSKGRIDFASFLDIMHDHSEVENCQRELLAGFRAQDVHNQGTVSGGEIRHILTSIGEKLAPNEVDNLFREAGISSRGQVRYKDFVEAVMMPSPDY